MTTTPKQRRGFAAMSPEKRAAISSKGGTSAHAKGTAHEFDSTEAARAGRLGGEAVSADRYHMAEIGTKGGRNAAVKRTALAVGSAAVENMKAYPETNLLPEAARRTALDRTPDVAEDSPID
jgi:uncharacterized protein